MRDLCSCQWKLQPSEQAQRLKPGSLVTHQHSPDAKLTLYAFLLSPNSKAMSLATSNRVFTISCNKENYYQRY